MPPKLTDAQKLANAKVAQIKEKRKFEKAISKMAEEKKSLHGQNVPAIAFIPNSNVLQWIQVALIINGNIANTYAMGV